MFIASREFELDKLALDPENPRLPSSLDRRDSQEVLRFLALSSSIDELISAIGENGYFASEPLIGVRKEDGVIVIVEGNRRLTALKLLAGATFEGLTRKIEEAVASAKIKPMVVPVAVYSEREDVLNYLGNKHIAGIKPWGALAKARYCQQLFNATEGENYTSRVRIVAKTIGSRIDFIGRSLKALEAYQYAEDRGFFGLAGVDENTVKFSLLSTALDYEGIQEFVYDDPSAPADERTLREGPLRELFEWSFVKGENNATRLGESRNINMLSKVVTNADGLKSFRLGVSLEQAFKLTDGLDEQFDMITAKVQESLREANGLAADVTPLDTRADTVRSIGRQSRQLKLAIEARLDD